jgi:hypothetical protein
MPWLWGLLTKAFLFHGYWQFSFDGPRHAVALGVLGRRAKACPGFGVLSQGMPWLYGRRFAFISERCSLSFLRRSFTAFEIRLGLRGTGGFLASKMALRNLLRASCLFFS